MNKDLVSAAISKHLIDTEATGFNVWLNSLVKSGYSGDILVLAYDFNEHDPYLAEILNKHSNVKIIIPTHDHLGHEVKEFVWHTGILNPTNKHILIHQIRFFHTWQYLITSEEKYKNVIITDARDVIFQLNPSEWLSKNLKNKLLCPSEMTKFGENQWCADLINLKHGPFIQEYLLKDREMINCGTIAGEAEFIKNLSLIIFKIACYIDGIYAADQTSLNILIWSLINDKIQVVDHNNNWALQFGMILYKYSNNTDGSFTLKNDNLLYCNATDTPFYLIHQYDRIPELKAMIYNKYSTLQ